MGAGDSVVNSSANGGNTGFFGMTFTMSITPSSGSDSEIAIVGNSSGSTFSTPSGWTDISGSHSTAWDSFSNATIQSSTTVTLNSSGFSGDNYGYIALEINP